MGRKLGAAVPLFGELGSNVTRCGLGWGLPWYQVVSYNPSSRLATTDIMAENWRLCSFWGSWVPI